MSLMGKNLQDNGLKICFLLFCSGEKQQALLLACLVQRMVCLLANSVVSTTGRVVSLSECRLLFNRRLVMQAVMEAVYKEDQGTGF